MTCPTISFTPAKTAEAPKAIPKVLATLDSVPASVSLVPATPLSAAAVSFISAGTGWPAARNCDIADSSTRRFLAASPAVSVLAPIWSMAAVMFLAF